MDATLKYRLNDDLSRVPGPYRLTKSMLMTPGAAGSYEFYRVRPQSADSGMFIDKFTTMLFTFASELKQISISAWNFDVSVDNSLWNIISEKAHEIWE